MLLFSMGEDERRTKREDERRSWEAEEIVVGDMASDETRDKESDEGESVCDENFR